jgi:formylmethanofuran dehydrogenase subunit E
MKENKDFDRCVEFHGHACPGLAIGFQAARILMDRLGSQKAEDEELLAILESNTCGADAIQVMTGCTFGKGNLIFKDYGKNAYSLASRKMGKTFRVCILSDVFSPNSEHLALFAKVQSDAASPEEMAQFRAIQKGRLQKILDASPENLFKIEEILGEIPEKAKVIQSITCDNCQELFRADFAHRSGEKKLCPACTDQDDGRLRSLS